MINNETINNEITNMGSSNSTLSDRDSEVWKNLGKKMIRISLATPKKEIKEELRHLLKPTNDENVYYIYLSFLRCSEQHDIIQSLEGRGVSIFHTVNLRWKVRTSGGGMTFLDDYSWIRHDLLAECLAKTLRRKLWLEVWDLYTDCAVTWLYNRAGLRERRADFIFEMEEDEAA